MTVTINIISTTNPASSICSLTRRLKSRRAMPSSRRKREIVVNDRHHQHHQHDESGKQHLLLDASAEVPPCNAFQQENQNVPPIEYRNRHQIQDAEIDAQHR